MKVTVIKFEDLVTACIESLEEQGAVDYMFSYDIEPLVREIVEVMQYRTTASINLMFETTVYTRLLKHINSFIASRERCIELSRDLVYKLTETIDNYVERNSGLTIRIDSCELVIDSMVFCIYRKEDMETSNEEAMSGRSGRRIFPAPFFG